MALLPGARSSPASVTNSGRGINGIVIDIAGAPGGATPTLDDFSFRRGTSPHAQSWADGARPASVPVRPGAGANGWLEVMVKANEHTGRHPPTFSPSAT
jgi:hypothetical protein